MTSARITSSKAGIVIGCLALVFAASNTHARQSSPIPTNPYDNYWSHIDVPEIARLGPSDGGRPRPPRPGMDAPMDDAGFGGVEPASDGAFGDLLLGPTRSEPSASDWGSIATLFYDTEPFGFDEIDLGDPLPAVSLVSDFQPSSQFDLGSNSPEFVVATPWGMAVPGPGGAGLLAGAVMLLAVRRRR